MSEWRVVETWDRGRDVNALTLSYTLKIVLKVKVSNEFEFPAKIKSQIFNYWEEIQDTFVKKEMWQIDWLTLIGHLHFSQFEI